MMAERGGGMQANEHGHRIAKPIVQLLELFEQPFVWQYEVRQGQPCHGQ
jgi:hypothetical protein